MIITNYGFLPSKHGFQFPNDFEKYPLLSIGSCWLNQYGFGDTSAGLCSGMTLAVIDYYNQLSNPRNNNLRNNNNNNHIPNINDPPSHTYMKVLFNYLRKRMLSFIYHNAIKICRWTMIQDNIRLFNLTFNPIHEGWNTFKRTLIPLTLIKILSNNPFNTKYNHVVLSYGIYTLENGYKIKIYDPNYPGDDDVSLIINTDDHIINHCAKKDNEDINRNHDDPTTYEYTPVRGVFSAKYKVWSPPEETNGQE